MRTPERTWALRPAPAAIVLSLAFLAGCVHTPPKIGGVPSTSPAPEAPWTPPPTEAAKPVQAGPAVPLDQIQEKLSRLTLPDVVDIALQNNPATRAAWADARSAAAKYGSSRGAYYPQLDLYGDYARSKSAGVTRSGAGSQEFTSIQTAYGPSAALSYLLFDFGGRSGSVEESRQSLLAADWTQNAVIQGTVLQVEVAFFNYSAAKALLEANLTSLQEAETNLAAAEERHKVGVATIADVLQARTSYSQVKLAVQRTEGIVRTTRGALAVSMGYPANVPYDVQVRAPEIPDYDLGRTVDQLIEQSMASRPDLQAARAQALASLAKVKEARAKMLPSLSLDATGGRTWLKGVPGSFDTYSGALLLHIPVFNGFSYQYDVMKAKADAEAAQERARGVEQQVIYQVFSSHSDFLTASERVKTAEDLIASAQQSTEVALGRYREGVGTILDLLSAQQALAQARAEQIGAKLGWFTALSQLAHDVGILGVHGENPLAPKGLSPEVKNE